MLRILYIFCDLLSSVLAIGSPVAVLHWLLKVTGIAGTASLVAALDPLFGPLNETLELVVHFPVLHYGGQTIPITQGVLACLMTIGFLGLNVCSEYLKAVEQRLDVARQASVHKRRLQQIKTEQKQLQKQVIGNRKIYVVIRYDFKGCPSGASNFETVYSRYGGKLIESSPQMLGLEFENVEKAFKYCIDSSHALRAYYSTLRPIDFQPPFQIAIQGVDAKLPGSEGILQTRKMISYIGENQIMFGPDMHTLMVEQRQTARFHFQSLGMYMLDGKQSELYRLFQEKKEQGAL